MTIIEFVLLGVKCGLLGASAVSVFAIAMCLVIPIIVFISLIIPVFLPSGKDGNRE